MENPAITEVQTRETDLPGCIMVRPAVHYDGRGGFSEVYNKRSLGEIGIEDVFVQDNVSWSPRAGTVRGLHFQIEATPVAKLVRVAKGALLDVSVDLRAGSPSFGRHVGVELSAESRWQLYVPKGFAHGFCTLADDTEIAYKVTDHWSAETDRGLLWNDPALNIDWPVDADRAIVSEKDRAQPTLAELPVYFRFGIADA